MAEILVGTSGWSYDHWIGPVYPPGSRSTDLLRHYARRFPTVEVNSTFYGLPKPKTVRAWAAQTPDGFVFSCKASRYLTHMKKLRDTGDGMARFFEAMAPLGAKLGPVLFQLPPRWRANAERLQAFLSALPDGGRYAFEFRDPSWFDAGIYEVLASHGAACCIYELGAWRSPLITVGDFVYVRLHGPGVPYKGSYGEAALDAWAARLTAWSSDGLPVYCYFDNDDKGFAAQDAMRLARRLDGTDGTGPLTGDPH